LNRPTQLWWRIRIVPRVTLLALIPVVLTACSQLMTSQVELPATDPAGTAIRQTMTKVSLTPQEDEIWGVAGNDQHGLAAVFIWGSAANRTLDAGEQAIIARLHDQGWSVTTVRADTEVATHEFTVDDANTYDLVLISKSVNSLDVGGTMKRSTTGILFWEANLMQSFGGPESTNDGSDRTREMLAFIDETGLGDTSWHNAKQQMCLDVPAGFEALAGGLSNGPMDFYTATVEQGFVPDVPKGAGYVRIGRYQDCGHVLDTLALYDAGTELADGSLAAGRRYFFGIYESDTVATTFSDLTASGIALWDAAVAWTAGQRP
jgi:hypothetical protein